MHLKVAAGHPACMRIHPAVLLGSALLALSFNDTLVYGIGEMTALQDRLLRPVVAVMILVVPGLALLTMGALAGARRRAGQGAVADEL